QRKLGVDPADGNFGESTDRAVRVFQGNEGLAVDGIVGPQTWGALFGGALNPAAASSESTPVLIPAVAGQEQRTDFAVRRASEKELEGLNVGGADLPKPTGKDSGLAAIEFRLPDEGDDSSAEASASAADEKSEKGAADSTEPERGALSALRNSADSEPATTAPTGATRRLDRGESKPPSSSKPKGDSDSDRGEDKGEDKPHSGSCGDSLKWPTAGKHITSGYGPRWGRTHAGVDIDTGTGDRIKAAACGVVTLMQSSGSSGGYGNYICVKHTSQFVTCYAHLSRFANVKVGDYVHQGETIGYSGCTGSCYGDHLHFETRRGTPYKSSNYSAFDPRPYLSGRSIPGSAVRSSSIGGPDLIEPTPQPKATSTVQVAEADSQRSAVEVATEDSAAPRSTTAKSSQPATATTDPAPTQEASEPTTSKGSASSSEPVVEETAPRTEEESTQAPDQEESTSPTDNVWESEPRSGDEDAREESSAGDDGRDESTSTDSTEPVPEAGAGAAEDKDASTDEGSSAGSGAASGEGSSDASTGGDSNASNTSGGDGSATETGGQSSGSTGSTGSADEGGSSADGSGTSSNGSGGDTATFETPIGSEGSSGDSSSTSGDASGASDGSTTSTNAGGSTSAGGSTAGSGSTGSTSGSTGSTSGGSTGSAGATAGTGSTSGASTGADSAGSGSSSASSGGSTVASSGTGLSGGSEGASGASSSSQDGEPSASTQEGSSAE
ncbi:MAG TPA: peptidoglycan DD-metalloendopeptidase family protein, partial [Thermoleophilaceae bacterium]|nr:peptidoglycan DD-metalloendopeptidase family protein [Thermoleophilaceae bacterium]